MRHIIFEDRKTYPIAILIKETGMNKQAIRRNYVDPLKLKGVKPEEVIIFSLDYNDKGKAPVKHIKEYMDTLTTPLTNLGVKLLYVADGAYFKAMTKVKKLDPHYGYTCDSYLPGYEDFKLILGVSYQALFHNPALNQKLEQSLDCLAQVHQGNYVKPGANIIKSAHYPTTMGDIKKFLTDLMKHPIISCDIEAFSLKHYDAGIGTIAFAWSENEGGAFAVDYQELTFPKLTDTNTGNNARVGNSRPDTVKAQAIRRHLIWFFENYEGLVVYHGITYDAKVLAYQLFMDDDLDYEGQLDGVEKMLKNVACTKVLAYLATNNCANNSLALKDVAQEFAGNWAEKDIKDIRQIPLPKLLEYNLTDCLATMFAFNKFMPIVIADNQIPIYHEIFIPMFDVIINAELNGMPMDDVLIEKYAKQLEANIQSSRANILTAPLIQKYNKILRYDAWLKRNLALKVKQVDLSDFDDLEFNPASNKQLQHLLYEEWKLPILAYTDSKAPAVGGKVLQGLLHRICRENKLVETDYQTYQVGMSDAAEKALILNSLIDLGKASKIANTFFKAFKSGRLKMDGMRYLHGNFNSTGTKSGRLSSSDPNMQNLPSTGTIYAKIVKECFKAPEGNPNIRLIDLKKLRAIIDTID